MSIILNENTDFSNNNLLYQEIKCGLGNQLLILFNLINLSEIHNYKFILSFINKNSKKYNIFKNINYSDRLNNENIKMFKKINEKDLSYSEINLNNKNTILNGYFQSYKYWWDQKHKIQDYLFIDIDLINNIKKIYNEFEKPIISIHIRLGDYLTCPENFTIITIDYYKKALEFYNLNNYQIILFSDNILLASEMLKPLNLNYLKADNFYQNDEEQLYMLMLSNIRICSCSTYSLASCYLNEIYNFVDNAEYIFPSKWGNNNSIKYNIDDIMINYKFITIDCNQLNNKIYDVITTLHEKDLENYNKYLSTNKKFLNNSNNFFYISEKKNDTIIESNHINENRFPFLKKDVSKYLKKFIPKERISWYYQQLLKLYIFKINYNLKDFVLILDADIIFLKSFYPYKNKKPILYYVNTNIYNPYIHSLIYLLPNAKIIKNKSSICHHMLFEKKILNNLLDQLDKKFKKPAWKSILDSVILYVKSFGYKISLFSEYELYANYVKNYYKNNYNFKNISFLDTNLSKFNWKDKQNYKFIGNHSWIR